MFMEIENKSFVFKANKESGLSHLCFEYRMYSKQRAGFPLTRHAFYAKMTKPRLYAEGVLFC